jgi:hypothetical protein
MSLVILQNVNLCSSGSYLAMAQDMLMLMKLMI